MKRIIYTLSSTFLFLISQVVVAQETSPVKKFTWKEAIEFGLQNNKKVQMHQLQSEISQLQIKDTKNEMLPDVTFHTGFHVLSNLNQYEDGFLHSPTTYHTPRVKYDFTLAAEIPIYEGGLIKNEIKKRTTEAKISKWKESKEKKDLRLQIVSAYLHVLHIEEQQELLKSKMHEDSLVIEQTLSLKKNGVVTQNEVLRTQLQLSNHKMSFSEWQVEKEIVEHEIKTMLSIPEEYDFHTNTQNLIEPKEDIPTQKIETVLENNENWQIAKEEIEVAEINKIMTKANVLPKISGGADYALNYPNFMFFPPEEYLYSIGVVGVNVVIPIGNMYKNKSKMSQASMKIEQAHLEKEEREEQIHHEVFGAKKRLEEANEKIEIAQQAIVQAEENYRIVKMKYINHLSLITELIDADNSYLETQSKLITLQINKQLKYYQLQYILGNL